MVATGFGTARAQNEQPRKARRGAACRRSTQRLLPGGLSSQRLCSRPGFLGLGKSARSCKPAPAGGRRPCAAVRALPAPGLPSPVNAPHAPVIVPASMMPGTARERIVTPPAGTALAPPPGNTSRRRPVRELDSCKVTERGTNFKRCLFISDTLKSCHTRLDPRIHADDRLTRIGQLNALSPAIRGKGGRGGDHELHSIGGAKLSFGLTLRNPDE